MVQEVPDGVIKGLKVRKKVQEVPEGEVNPNPGYPIGEADFNTQNLNLTTPNHNQPSEPSTNLNHPSDNLREPSQPSQPPGTPYPPSNLDVYTKTPDGLTLKLLYYKCAIVALP
jgi:hypothetical protein